MPTANVRHALGFEQLVLALNELSLDANSVHSPRAVVGERLQCGE